MITLSIRKGTIQDLDRISEIEREVFPAVQAASREKYEWRIKNIGNYFFVAEHGGKIVGFIFSRLTELDIFTDELYEKEILPEGKYLAILTVATDASYQKKGIAGELIKHSLSVSKDIGLKGATLACKDDIVSYYSKFGFELVGKSLSEHGGFSWNDMRIIF